MIVDASGTATTTDGVGAGKLLETANAGEAKLATTTTRPKI